MSRRVYSQAEWCQIVGPRHQELVAAGPCSTCLRPYQGNVGSITQDLLISVRTAALEPVPLARQRCFQSQGDGDVGAVANPHVRNCVSDFKTSKVKTRLGAFECVQEWQKVRFSG